MVPDSATRMQVETMNSATICRNCMECKAMSFTGGGDRRCGCLSKWWSWWCRWCRRGRDVRGSSNVWARGGAVAAAVPCAYTTCTMNSTPGTSGGVSVTTWYSIHRAPVEASLYVQLCPDNSEVVYNKHVVCYDNGVLYGGLQVHNSIVLFVDSTTDLCSWLYIHSNLSHDSNL